ncbi:MAG: TrkH family potassium uptake protein [Dysgonamonadaceae bacterium]|jgi:trk system potassium uptake protein TrkH|nr:TrkH family potassium uptake protein [Dysgonamonadaceae bacterium]
MFGNGLNWKFILRIGGLTLAIESLFMFVTTGVSFYYGESPHALAISGVITLAAGLALALPTDIRSKIKLIGKRESYMGVTVTWVLFAAFGALPFFLSREIPLYTDAFFESTSGVTTSGGSILTNVEAMSKGLLFWRSLLNWLGGLGIILFSLALFPLIGGEAAQLFDAETSGLTHDRFRPRVTEMAKRLWLIYVSFTVILIALLIYGKMEVFDAICQAFSTISTGGFSTRQSSVAYWDSIYIESVISVFMIIGGVNFSLFYFLFKGKFKRFWKDEELHWYIGILFVASIVITLGLVHARPETEFLRAFRTSYFQVISIFTTTGFTSGDYVSWGPPYWIVVLFLMLICGCAGSTSGGMKTIRAVVLAKSTFSEFRRLLNPRAIVPVRLNGNALSFEVVQRLIAFCSLYVIIILFSWCILTMAGMTFDEAIGAAVSSLSNVGPGFGSNGPSGSFAGCSVFAKWYLSALMIVGRLELFTVLILFTPAFWKK